MMLIKELLEAVRDISPEMSMDEAFAEMEKRLAASRKALAAAVQLKNPEQRATEMLRIRDNIKSIQRQLSHDVSRIERMTHGEEEFIKGKGQQPNYSGPERRRPRSYDDTSTVRTLSPSDEHRQEWRRDQGMRAGGAQAKVDYDKKFGGKP